MREYIGQHNNSDATSDTTDIKNKVNKKFRVPPIKDYKRTS